MTPSTAKELSEAMATSTNTKEFIMTTANNITSTPGSESCNAIQGNPKPWVVVRNPGRDDEDIVDDFATSTKAYRFIKNNPGTDLMKRLNDGSLTSDF
jgi:hypothetical protein